MSKVSNWEQGEPCPECGGTDISVRHEVEEIYHSENGEFAFQDNGQWMGEVTDPMCLNCEEEL